MKKKRILIAGLAALAAAATIGGTWAVWTDKLVAKNEFMTAKYSTFLREEFTEPTGWLPGEETKKAVWVENKAEDSTIPIIAQITLSQSWLREADITAWVEATPGEITPGKAPIVEKVVAPEGEELDLTFAGSDGDEFAAVIKFNTDWNHPENSKVVVLKDSDVSGLAEKLGIPAVDSLEKAEGKWLFTSAGKEEGNYTFYYMGLVNPGEKTPELITSVTMNPELQATVTGSNTYYVEDAEAEDGYYTITVDTYDAENSYDSSKYTLNVTMKTVQATKDAVEWGYQPVDEVVTYIAENIADSGVYEADPKYENTLCFDEVNGKMCYYPIDKPSEDGETGNWFMNFTNMVPGGTYIDKLNIENRSKKKYELFMQIKPRVQEELKDELLKKISMEIYYGSGENEKLLYKGDATGYHYTDANGTDMQNLVNLGYYYAGRKEQLRVVLQLDPNIGLNDDGTYKYADLLTKIDWEFYVTEDTDGRDGGGGNGGGGGGGGGRSGGGPGGEVLSIDDELIPLGLLPATGDNMPVIPVMVTALVSMFLMLLFAKLSRKEKAEQ